MAVCTPHLQCRAAANHGCRQGTAAACTIGQPRRTKRQHVCTRSEELYTRTAQRSRAHAGASQRTASRALAALLLPLLLRLRLDYLGQVGVGACKGVVRRLFCLSSAACLELVVSGARHQPLQERQAQPLLQPSARSCTPARAPPIITCSVKLRWRSPPIAVRISCHSSGPRARSSFSASDALTADTNLG